MLESTPNARALPAWLSPLVLLAAAAYLASRWEQIPDRWVIHWGARGIPNGWATKTTLGVYGLLLVGGAIWLLMEGAGAVAKTRSQKDPALAGIEGATVQLLRLLSTATSLMFGALAILLPLGPHPGPLPIVMGSFGLVLGAILIGSTRISRAIEQARREGHAERFKGYKGLFYANPDDPRLWVPKLMGMGITINFANPWAWPMMLLLAGVPIATVILGLVAASR